MKVNLTVQDGSQNAYRKIIVEWQKKKKIIQKGQPINKNQS